MTRFDIILSFLATAAPCLAAEPGWAGSAACQPCHAAIFKTYARTPMALSSGVVGSGLILESFEKPGFRHERSGVSYRMSHGDSSYEVELKKGAMTISQKLSFYIGSGAIARSYAEQINGFLYQASVAYYSQGGGRWDLAPGYDRYEQPFLTRAILPGCLQCHSSFVQHRERTHNGYDSPPFLEGGVACERCHGPGREHIRTSGSRALIVNPAKLDAERRDSVCAQCHLAGEVRVQRVGKTADSFRAGDRLRDHVAVFTTAGGTAGMRVTSHVENLAQSACKKAAGDTMQCGSCHDPHLVPAATERAAWFRSKCLACHQSKGCKGPGGDDCTSCHMQRGAVSDAQHVVYTDHAIRRRPRVAQALPPAREAVRLVPFGGGLPEDRDLGLAYAILGQKDRALPLLRGKKDAESLLYLAEIYKQRGDYGQAVPLFEDAIRLDPGQLTASVSLGAIRMEQGNYSAAVRLWEDALSKNPALPLVRANLAIARQKMGH